MKNIYIRTSNLYELNEVLKKDNNDIKQIMENIKNCFAKLDDSVWKSPEKDSFAGEFIPYLDKINISLYDDLNKYTSTIDQAIIKYGNQEHQMKKDLSNLENGSGANVRR